MYELYIKQTISDARENIKIMETCSIYYVKYLLRYVAGSKSFRTDQRFKVTEN